MKAEALKGHLDGMLLAALEDGPRHGYAVIEHLREASGGHLDLPTGTIYPALHRLEEAGLVTGSWSTTGGRRRRSYVLTAAGREALQGRARRVAVVRLRGRLGTGGEAVAEPRLIRDYLAALDTQLPAEIVEELADGLDETYRHLLAIGLDPQAAAHTALAEFGQPETIATAFTREASARRAARTLLGAGPAVGGCWAAALIGARAWDWAIPAAVLVTFAAGLAVVIALLATAAFCDTYRAARRAAAAALIGLALLDVTLPGALVIPGLLRGWPLLVAAGLSLSRAAYAAGAFRRIHVS